MIDDLQICKENLRKAEELLEHFTEENRQWRVAVISKLADDTKKIDEIFACVREGGLPDEFIECHLFQIAKDRDRWKARALKAESKLKEMA